MAAPTQASPQFKRLVLLLWIVLAFFYFYVSYEYIQASNTDRTMDDYLQYVVRLAATEQRPAKEVRALILVKADELHIPLTGEEIKILGGGTALSVSFDYQANIEVPLLHRAFYRRTFHHEAKFEGRPKTEE